jgi:hypothetical protein
LLPALLLLEVLLLLPLLLLLLLAKRPCLLLLLWSSRCATVCTSSWNSLILRGCSAMAMLICISSISRVGVLSVLCASACMLVSGLAQLQAWCESLQPAWSFKTCSKHT